MRPHFLPRLSAPRLSAPRLFAARPVAARPVTGLARVVPVPGAGIDVRCTDISQIFEVDGDQVVALADVNLHIHPGESVALFGPSGSGKSTLTALLAGLRRPSAGQVWLGEDNLSTQSERQLLRIRGTRIGVVVQNPNRSLLPYGTAEDNILFAQRGVERRRRATVAPATLLRQLGLAELAGQRAGRLSGGEQQRLSIAVAMTGSPRLLLADEPTSQLDGRNRDLVVELLTHVREQFGTTIVVVTHDPVVADAMDRRITLADGRVVAIAPTTDVAIGFGAPPTPGRSRRLRFRRNRRCAAPDPPERAGTAGVPVQRAGGSDGPLQRAGGSDATVAPPIPAGALVADQVSYARSGRIILDRVSVVAAPGTALAVVGPSGSGKSSLLALMAGLEPPDSGSVRRHGYREGPRCDTSTSDTPSSDKSRRDQSSRERSRCGKFRRETTGLVLQGYGLVSVLTAAENVEVPLQTGALGRLSRAETRARAATALAAVGLSAVADHLIEELSGGQQQRVAVARALVLEPTVLFADEVTAELDHEWQDHVVELVLDVARAGGIVALATHDPQVVARCDHVLRLVDGRVAD